MRNDLDGVSESATLKLNAMVQALKAKGVDVVNLTAGEPDFNVPEEAKRAVIDALAPNKSKYTPVAGIPELREASRRKPIRSILLSLRNRGKPRTSSSPMAESRRCSIRFHGALESGR